jgi:hypothetical protein
MTEPSSAEAGDAAALLFRHVVQERLLALFPRGARLLAPGCASEDVRVLVARGRRVWAGAEAPPPEGFDGAYADLRGTGTRGPAALGEALASRLAAGAVVLVRFRSPSPLPAALRHALAGERPSPLEARPFTAAEVRGAFGARFQWSHPRALGVVLPWPDGGWAAEHPQAFGLLAAAERAVRGWPVLRGLGAETVLEGRRV